MDTTKAIQIAVARADLIVCSVLRWMVVIVPLTVILLLAVIAFREWAYTYCDPYLIDYDSPGVDITSEGPDDDYTDAWYEWRDDQ